MALRIGRRSESYIYIYIPDIHESWLLYKHTQKASITLKFNKI